jgi:ABC-2 type transport system ATP-binding protein
LPLRRVGEVLDRVGLGGRGDDRYRSYSLGMKQRLGIAAALLPAPSLLVLDEPTNGLDPAGIAQMRELISSFRDDGMTVLVSSHLLAEIEQVADHLVLIRAGRVAFQGPGPGRRSPAAGTSACRSSPRRPPPTAVVPS